MPSSIAGTFAGTDRFPFRFGAMPARGMEDAMARGILLWMLGVPIPIILLLAMCSHH